MLAILFQVGSDRYALPARDLFEVLPLVRLKQVPPTPPYFAGLLNYRGGGVPVIDLSMLMTGIPSRHSLSSRLLVAQYRPPGGPLKPLGLIAERATEAVALDPDNLCPSEVATRAYLGKLVFNGTEIVQLVHCRDLLTDDARALLFPDVQEDDGARAGPN